MSPEWLAGVDRIQKLLAHLGGQPCLRSRPFANTCIVTIARRQTAHAQPSFQRAVLPCAG